MSTTAVTTSQAVAALISTVGLLFPFFALAFLLRARIVRGGADVALLAAPLVWVAAWALALEVLSLVESVSWFAIRAIAAGMMLAALTAIPWWWQGVSLVVSDAQRTMRTMTRELSVRVWWRIPLLLAVGFTLFAVMATLLVAIVSAPNNPDSLAYHLPRVMWWLQEG